ncbi:NTP pyrophosphohydrolase-like domain [Vibrio phage 1.174.O._10N.261.55.A8]|nr:NTP pyrophosphohydrolase-like domain [Vibrio phage 1.174.O._10N.261.55.A8]
MMSHYECKECQKPYQYCECKQENKMNELKRTKEWFEQAIPEPTMKDKRVQIGCHFEEFGEMLDSIGYEKTPELEMITHEADWFKGKKSHFTDQQEDMIIHCNKDALLDSLADQMVTAIGVCHMMGFDIEGALAEVNRSNFSKFEDGKPVFDANGKITKGKHYTPPELGDFIK